MDRKDRKDRNQAPIRLSLETEAPLKVGQEFHLLTTAIVTRGNQTLEEKMVQFFLSGATVGNPAQTDENGRVQYEIIVPLGTKSIVIEAQLVGQAPRARKIISLPEEKRGRPFDLEIKTEGREGKYLVNATIITEDGTGIKGIIRMLTGKAKQDFPTDEQGVAFLELEVTERQEEFKFLVLGTTIDKMLRLSGPKRAKPIRPEPTQENLAGGFWKALRIGWRKRKEEER